MTRRMTWFQRLWHRDEMERRLDQELDFHLDQHAQELIARGVDPEEAHRQARMAMGGPEQMKEECRDARGTRWLEDFWQDLRYAVRTLRQRPGFAAVALLTLALGIGATTVMFTLINGVLLKPLPYSDPDRLVFVQEKTDWSNQFGNLWAYAYPNYLDCKREVRSLELAASRWQTGTISEPGDAENISGREITWDFLPTLGVGVYRGRTFLPEDDRSGAPPVAIIGYSLWQRHFGGSENALGSRLVFDGMSYTVIGVMPANFRWSYDELDILTPLGQDTSPPMPRRDRHTVSVIGRISRNATLSQARAQLAVVGRQLATQYPESNKGRSFIADPLRFDDDTTRSTLWLLFGAVSLVLSIACVNVASLLLARAVSRQRELAMRVALGAGRGRLARQCLTESCVMGIGGGSLGVLLTIVSLKPFLVFWPGGLPGAESVQLDWRVLLFALAVSLLSGALFGLAPALRAPSQDLEQTLRAGARTVAGGSRRLHSAFVVSEISLAAMLLVSAGMLGRTLLHFASLDPGVNIKSVITARANLSPATLKDPARTRAVWQAVLDRARRIPGIESIAMVDTIPMREGDNQIGYGTSANLPPDDKQPLTLATCVTPDYLKVMGLTLLQGRFLTDQDRLGAQSVVVIDEVMAREAFRGEEPLGKHLWIGLDNDPVTVVGLVRHVRRFGPAGDDQAQVRAQLYYPFAQVPDRFVLRWSNLMSLAARTSVDPLTIVQPLRRVLRGTNHDQVLFEIHTMEQLASANIGRQRFLMLLFGIFAGLALALACIGIYGVLAYLTSQRVPEIGVRIALGAKTQDVMWMVLKQSLAMIVIGIAVGAAGALAASSTLTKLVDGMQPTGFSTFAIMMPVLTAAALIASFIPARRASRVDPVKALRQE